MESFLSLYLDDITTNGGLHHPGEDLGPERIVKIWNGPILPKGSLIQFQMALIGPCARVIGYELFLDEDVLHINIRLCRRSIEFLNGDLNPDTDVRERFWALLMETGWKEQEVGMI